mgnify:CR=1 FL=1
MLPHGKEAAIREAREQLQAALRAELDAMLRMMLTDHRAAGERTHDLYARVTADGWDDELTPELDDTVDLETRVLGTGERGVAMLAEDGTALESLSFQVQ